MSNDQKLHSLEQQLSELDWSAKSPVQVRLYRRLKRRAEHPIYHQPAHVTFFSRLGSVILLALILGAFLGMFRFQESFSHINVTAFAVPSREPVETPGTAIVTNELPSNVQPRPLPTPLAPTLEQRNWPVLKTGTLNP